MDGRLGSPPLSVYMYHRTFIMGVNSMASSNTMMYLRLGVLVDISGPYI